MAQIVNPEAIELYSAHFPKRKDASYAWGRVNGILQNIPYCSGIWNFALRNGANEFSDLSGCGKFVVGGGTTSLYGGITPYLSIPGTGAGPYYPDSPELGFSGSMQLSCWVWFNAVAARQDYF
jgi:hypothetical protein